MSNLIKLTAQVALTASLLGSMSLAIAASGTSGTSGSAGATIDTGGGGAVAGSGAGTNPKLGAGAGGPVGLLAEVFGAGDDPAGKKKKKAE